MICVIFGLYEKSCYKSAGYAFGRYPHSSPGKRAFRTSSGVCEPDSSAQSLGRSVEERPTSPKQKNPDPSDRDFFVLEVTAGFEPADNGVADRGLTTWLRHQIFNAYILYQRNLRLSRALR